MRLTPLVCSACKDGPPLLAAGGHWENRRFWRHGFELRLLRRPPEGHRKYKRLREANVEAVACACALSVRTLHRRCRERLGITPGRLIDRLRVDHARSLVATSELSAKILAAQCGFGTTTHMKRAFERELGVGPRDYRLLHTRGRTPVRNARRRT